MKWDIYIYRNSGVPLIIDCTQGSNDYEWEFEVKDYKIPSGAEVRIFMKKPSGTEIYNYCTVNGNIIKPDITTQMTAEAGKIPAQFQIVPVPGNPDNAKPFLFWLNVQQSLETSSQIESKDEFEILDNLINEARQTIQEANQAIENIDKAVEAGLTPEKINAAVESYLEKHPIDLDCTPTLEGTTLVFPSGADASGTLTQAVQDLLAFMNKFNGKTIYEEVV